MRKTGYARWFDARVQRVINVATRRQGLIVAPGNPRKIYGLADLARPDVPLANLMLAFAQKTGVETERFGQSTGALEI